MLTTEFLDSLTDLVRKAQVPRQVCLHPSTTHIAYNGHLHTVTHPPSPRIAELNTLQSFTDGINNLLLDHTDRTVTVWISDNHILALPTDAPDSYRLRLPLRHTTSFATLLSWDRPTTPFPLSPTDLVRTIRHYFTDSFDLPQTNYEIHPFYTTVYLLPDRTVPITCHCTIIRDSNTDTFTIQASRNDIQRAISITHAAILTHLKDQLPSPSVEYYHGLPD